ncbi:O-methylsterigmatocystin oxidoreductase OS=Aspergillus parasiticus GN=ordA PE=3 SV=1 [Rhizoctonia solani AG-1 IB]|uniref:O-methylsterigmatocystin oxidoreductase n=1 Tax=Thanatephorus cucumeris (strain AG1-IB / isolate 7/3/14) TaxID=1108050 RepID=A0A0B7FYG7_THACB|nr:O-methylsterigmatocystin oxidoreductase OS=Aspergillus parasiticus GN=ordA PE=3 SV=1 [Rhizoctonia solani AG-1 IB]
MFSPAFLSVFALWLGPWVPALLVGTIIGLLLFHFHRAKSSSLLPPSPPKHWFWGNKDIVSQPHRFVALGIKYKDSLGDIIATTTPFDTFITVNTIELATELLEKHASVSSNRPSNVMIQDLLGWSEGVSFHQHDEWHKKQRRILASALHPTAARSYESQHLDSTVELLRRISRDPGSFQKHVSDIVGDFILRLAYGYTPGQNDTILATVHRAFSYLAKASAGYFLVNDFPILRYVPAWFPGGSFQTFAKEGREFRVTYANTSFDMVFEQVRNGGAETPSYLSQLLESKGGANITDIDMELTKWTAASLFTGGSTTTVGMVWSFVLMLSLHPEAAKLAQAEIDAVVGRERVPDLKDRESMPYMEAVLQEVMRLCPVVPLGLPHTTTEDIQLGGYRIPKNATINPNIWAMLRDPKHFASPHTFDPSRFLKPVPDPDPRKYIFGFGRRVCPGQHVASNAMWVMCAGILAAFNLEPGSELLTKVGRLGGPGSQQMYKLFQPHLVYDPLPFPCALVPRDQAAIELLANSAH